MVEPTLTLQILADIRTELKRVNARMDHEFSEIRDRLQRIDERIDGLTVRVERLEK
jgi:hypothetical protein